MIQTAFCDDEEYIHYELDNLVKEYNKSSEMQFSLNHYMSGQDMLDDEKLFSFEVIFLDIEMPGMDGIKLGQLIKNSLPNSKIIMLTGRTDRYKDAYKINAFRFVTKPICKKELFEALDDFVKEERLLKTISVRKEGIKYNLSLKKIVYIESCHDYIKIYTEKMMYDKNCSMNYISQELDNSVFYRCHNRYIINLMFVEKMDALFFYLETRDNKNNTIVIPISKRRKAEALRRFSEYDTAL